MPCPRSLSSSWQLAWDQAQAVACAHSGTPPSLPPAAVACLLCTLRAPAAPAAPPPITSSLQRQPLASFSSSSKVAWKPASQPGALSSSAPQQSQNLQRPGGRSQQQSQPPRRRTGRIVEGGGRGGRSSWQARPIRPGRRCTHRPGDALRTGSSGPSHLSSPFLPTTASSWSPGSALARTNPMACGSSRDRLSGQLPSGRCEGGEGKRWQRGGCCRLAQDMRPRICAQESDLGDLAAGVEGGVVPGSSGSSQVFL